MKFALTLAVTIAVSAISWQLIERPINGMKDILSTKKTREVAVFATE